MFFVAKANEVTDAGRENVVAARGDSRKKNSASNSHFIVGCLRGFGGMWYNARRMKKGFTLVELLVVVVVLVTLMTMTFRLS